MTRTARTEGKEDTMTSEQQSVQTTADIAYGTPAGQAQSGDDASTRGRDGATEATETSPLLPHDRADDLNAQWANIQGQFVDMPREAVEQADHLVAEVIQDLARTFADERASLEEQWGRDEDVDTESLRLALQRYRSFFHRLLAA